MQAMGKDRMTTQPGDLYAFLGRPTPSYTPQPSRERLSFKDL